MPRVILRNKIDAARPSSPWICEGCYLFRRASTSVFDFEGRWVKDRQTPRKWPWLLTETEAVTVLDSNREAFQSFLLAPPTRFCLMLLDGPEQFVRLHAGIVNDREILEGTTLQFTVNNVPHIWTVATLKHAILNGQEGVEGGVRFLLDKFGPWKTDRPEGKRGRGKWKVEDAKVLARPVR